MSISLIVIGFVAVYDNNSSNRNSSQSEITLAISLTIIAQSLSTGGFVMVVHLLHDHYVSPNLIVSANKRVRTIKKLIYGTTNRNSF
jgi:hypothetical protein